MRCIKLFRCSTRYGEKKSSIARVKYLISKDAYHILREVKWTKSPTNILKLNTDGSALRNPSKIGGGILRDSNGEMVYAFIIPLGIGTNNQAETQAATHGKLAAATLWVRTG
ncbi:hypothetical protein KY290_026149 [Solanum tuberosum]|uniref:RNase H type-1 domain-containing protein n=1 Tax=Solanum tuberosum TaxID=4113 RepID=A0ABQ7UVL1_SOLTU|nr:hypothetical protein KY284_032766 [Solanum tuberosum]KAH0670750.1 hypothetical protein KY289_025243 [Solanum tuberosum]KAH0677219.1 hypothetical protein KY285_025020 [Solanum tuberosum]KAH0755879.1 hypothetical protein KY290_026149 [Solanum tuberosum]